MKKFLFFLFLTGVCSMSVEAQRWVNFSSGVPAAPQLNLQTSDAKSVSFEVTIPGVYLLDTIVNHIAFTRLSILGGGVVNPAGAPEIPVLTYRVAIPECAGVQVAYNIVSQQKLTPCLVYPVPEFVPDNRGNLVEQFIFDPVAYAQPNSGNEPVAEVTSTGALRAQQYVEVMVCPVVYCPVSQQLSVIDQIEVTLTFTNPQGELRQNTGIFNKVATNAFINYEDDGMSALVNDKAFEKAGSLPSNVRWINLTDTAMAKTIVADYLIICENKFFNPHNADIQRLAEHRAFYNGYDVAIVNVAQILALNFLYENPIPEYRNEQKMRTCIRRIYEGAHAAHTGDGKLGYVLLVGDNYGENEGMPTGFEHGVRTNTSTYGDPVFASDYYFSCLTKGTDGAYDDVAELSIGRFSVETPVQLYNMVEKTIYREKKFDTELWRKKAGIVHGWISTLSHYPEIVNFFSNLLNGNGYTPTFVGTPQIRIPTLNCWNDGVVYSSYNYENSYWPPTEWEDRLYVDTIKLRLHNDYKNPFMACFQHHSGFFDNPSGFFYNGNCMAEEMTRYHATRGAVGFIAASRIAPGVWYGSPGYNNRYGFDQCVPYLLFDQNHKLSIAGDLLWTSKVFTYYGDATSEKPIKYAYNLFGDPALNILATGYELTDCITLNTISTLSDKIVVKNGGCLIVPVNGVLTLNSGGNITVEAGGRIEMRNNAKITGASQYNDNRYINILPGAIVVIANNNSAVIENLNFQIATDSISNVRFNNVNFTRPNTVNAVFNMKSCNFFNSTVTFNNYTHSNVTNCSFTDTKLYSQSSRISADMNFHNSQFLRSPLAHYDHFLQVYNCTLTNRSDINTRDGDIDIQNCSFSASGFMASSIQKLIGMPFVQVGNSSFRNTGQFMLDYDIVGDSIYSTAAIMLRGISEFLIIGNSIINVDIKGAPPYGEGIYLTGSGNNGNIGEEEIQENEISRCETGLFVYASKANILGNRIFNNIYGARLFNNSQTSFIGDDETPFHSYGEQIIRDNSSYQLYASQYAFPVPFSYNQISKINNPHDFPWIYYDETSLFGIARAIDVRYNCWGEKFEPITDLYPVKRYSFNPTWCPTGKAPSLSPEEELYQTAIDYFANEDYINAEITFKDLITTYPNSPFAIAALHELFALEQFLNNDYAALNGYYSTFTPADTALFNVAAFLATRCNIQERNWQPAIDWYENRIENPPSYQDSVFAVIDLGDIHLMMAADTLGGAKSMHHCSYRLAQVKPNSKREYEENKTTLLATLPRIAHPTPQPEPPQTAHRTPLTAKGALGQNIPNPTKGTAIIEYEIYTEGVVEIRVYNVLGQLIQTLPHTAHRSPQTAGKYQTTISLSNVPAGVYNYMLFIDGEKADGKKMVKQ